MQRLRSGRRPSGPGTTARARLYRCLPAASIRPGLRIGVARTTRRPESTTVGHTAVRFPDEGRQDERIVRRGKLGDDIRRAAREAGVGLSSWLAGAAAAKLRAGALQRFPRRVGSGARGADALTNWVAPRPSSACAPGARSALSALVRSTRAPCWRWERVLTGRMMARLAVARRHAVDLRDVSAHRARRGMEGRERAPGKACPLTCAPWTSAPWTSKWVCCSRRSPAARAGASDPVGGTGCLRRVRMARWHC